MKKLLPVLLALVLGLSACGTAAPQESKTDDSVTVLAATTYPVYLFACAVTEGLDDYDVQLIIDQPVNCLHDYTLSVRDMKAIEAADVILINGAGLESAMEDALSSSGRKPVIDCSKGIELLPASGAEHEGAVHDNGSGDPHIWMDPALACQMTNTISDELSRLDPSHAEDFAGNAQAASSQISSCYDLCKEKLKDLSPREIITFHDGFAYFSRAFDLTVLQSIEEEAGSEASAREVAGIIDLIRTHHLPAVFVEANGPDSTAEAIAEEIGEETPFTVGELTMIMSPDPDHKGIDAYCAGITRCVNAIQEAYS